MTHKSLSGRRRERYNSRPIIYSKKNAGTWVGSKKGKILATDENLSGVLQKVKNYKREEIRLDLVPRTPFVIGGAFVPPHATATLAA